MGILFFWHGWPRMATEFSRAKNSVHPCPSVPNNKVAQSVYSVAIRAKKEFNFLTVAKWQRDKGTKPYFRNLLSALTMRSFDSVV